MTVIVHRRWAYLIQSFPFTTATYSADQVAPSKNGGLASDVGCKLAAHCAWYEVGVSRCCTVLAEGASANQDVTEWHAAKIHLTM